MWRFPLATNAEHVVRDATTGPKQRRFVFSVSFVTLCIVACDATGSVHDRFEHAGTRPLRFHSTRFSSVSHGSSLARILPSVSSVTIRSSLLLHAFHAPPERLRLITSTSNCDARCLARPLTSTRSGHTWAPPHAQIRGQGPCPAEDSQVICGGPRRVVVVRLNGRVGERVRERRGGRLKGVYSRRGSLWTWIFRRFGHEASDAWIARQRWFRCSTAQPTPWGAVGCETRWVGSRRSCTNAPTCEKSKGRCVGLRDRTMPITGTHLSNVPIQERCT